MILLDLKLALFMAILGVMSAFTAAVWLCGRRRPWPRGARGMSQQAYELVPFGMIMLRPDDTIVSSNPAAAQIMHGLGAGTTAELPDMLRPYQDGIQQFGRIHRSLPVRWWRYPLEDEYTLLILFDGSDRQQFIRQQQAFISHLSHEMRTPCGLPAYITSTNIVTSASETPPAQTYPAGWLTAALTEIDREPQVQALCWFVDEPLGEIWNDYGLSRHPGKLHDADDEFDRLLRGT